MQTHIHNVPVLGRIAKRFHHLIPEIEKITQPPDWTNLGAVIFNDEEISYTQDYEAGRYIIYDVDHDDGFTLTYNNGEKEILQAFKGVPYILLESGYLQDDYWFVFTLLHELGHHNDPNRPNEPTFEGEVFAHQFALTKMSVGNFECTTEDFPRPKFLDDAIQLLRE